MGADRTVVLRTEALSKVYRPPAGLRRLLMRSPINEPITAVDDVSIEVRRGEVFGLLGPNGAGKTTLIKLLTTLLQPSSGKATVCGHDIVEEEQRVRHLIGLTMSEERSFYYRLSGRQNLEFFASLANVPNAEVRERIDESLQLLDLLDEADNMFYSYSSGMRQKLSIARGLLSRPQVLFLDEPTKNVDALAASDLKRLIKEKLSGDSGRTVLLATHRMEEAEQLCDRIAILRSGRVVFCGTIPELRLLFGGSEECSLRLKGGDPELCRLLATRHGLQGVRFGRPGNNGVLEMRFSTQPDSLQLSDLLRDILRSGAAVLSFDRRERGLEEMFVDMVRREARAS